MKKINELKSERAELITKMETIANSETLTDESRTEWTGLDDQIKKIDSDIVLAERQEELNKTNVRKMEVKTPIIDRKPMGVEFRDWLKDAAEKGGKSESFRADPIITTTDTGMINKTVYPGIDVLTSPGEAFLRKIGATFFTGLTGNLCLNSMAEDLATFPGENTGAASAGMAPAALTLAARRLTHTQAISKETLFQSNPAVYAAILQALLDGVWTALVTDYFSTIISDGVVALTIASGSAATYRDLTNLEAAVGYLNVGPCSYVTTPAVKAQCQVTATMSNQAPLWVNIPGANGDGVMNGYPAYSTPGQTATYITFGDFSKAAVAQWGGLEVIVDPYSDAKKGLLNLTVVGLFDTGCFNIRGLSIVPIA